MCSKKDMSRSDTGTRVGEGEKLILGPMRLSCDIKWPHSYLYNVYMFFSLLSLLYRLDTQEVEGDDSLQWGVIGRSAE